MISWKTDKRMPRGVGQDSCSCTKNSSLILIKFCLTFTKKAFCYQTRFVIRVKGGGLKQNAFNAILTTSYKCLPNYVSIISLSNTYKDLIKVLIADVNSKIKFCSMKVFLENIETFNTVIKDFS